MKKKEYIEEEVEEDDIDLNDEEDDEYDQEDLEDDNFIAADEEVLREELEAKLASKKEKQKKRGPKTYTDDFVVD